MASSRGSDVDDDEEPEAKPRPSSHVLGSNTSTNTHAFILITLCMLAFDTLNPVKRVNVLLFHSADASNIGWLCAFLLFCLVLQDLANVCFYAARIFLNAIMSIAISKVDVIGTEHIPTSGPVILVANHSNQFVDGMCIVCSCQQRKLGFLIARKSYDHPIIGFFARVMAAVPVTRPQDIAFKGAGALVQLKPADDAHTTKAVTKAGSGGPNARTYLLVGSASCKFKGQLGSGAKLTVVDDSERAWTWRVHEVCSETACLVRLDLVHKAPPADLQASLPASGAYRVLPRGDFEEAFTEVQTALEGGSAICLFPEGGSHDHPDLLELKPGVALIALGVKRPVPIVPIGLSYFRGHAFRASKVTVHIGPPIVPSPTERLAYGVGGEQRREACKVLLSRIENALRAVIVPAASLEELQLIHVTRRLWCGPTEEQQSLDPAVRQDLDRRFAFGIQRLLKSAKLKSPAEAASQKPRNSWSPGAVRRAAAKDQTSREKKTVRQLEIEALVGRLSKYDAQLRRLGLRDSQVQSLERAPVFRTLFTLGHMVTMLFISSLPSLMLNLPVGLAAVAWAKWCQQLALAKSKIKVTASDVVLSEKIKFAIVAVPALWLTYATVLLIATPLHLQDVLTLLMLAPAASYLGVISAESGMIALRDLRPMLARLFYDHRRVEALKGEQLDLQNRVREELQQLLVHDPVVRELYHMRGEVGAEDWERLGQGVSKEVELASPAISSPEAEGTPKQQGR